MAHSLRKCSAHHSKPSEAEAQQEQKGPEKTGLIEKEERETGTVNMEIYKAYFFAGGSFLKCALKAFVET